MGREKKRETLVIWYNLRIYTCSLPSNVCCAQVETMKQRGGLWRGDRVREKKRRKK